MCRSCSAVRGSQGVRPPAAIRRSVLEHGRVVKAILKGDSKGAERAMREHIESSAAAILAAPEEFFSV